MKALTRLAVCIAVAMIFFLSGFAFGEGDTKKKVFYINSYHEGYEWSDGINQAIQEVFADKDVDMRTVTMDTKRNPGEKFKIAAGLRAKQALEAFRPDVVISSDDNAFKYVIMPYYKDSDLPVVFCGLNWDASIYGAPYKNTTGMVEVALIPQLLDHLRQYSRGNRTGYLEVDVLTARKEAEYIKKVFKLDLKEEYVTTLDEWKKAFVELQKDVDILLVGNNAGINDWDEFEARRFVEENTKIPTGGIYTWMMPYVLLGVTKVEKEQGKWAAQTALKILNGTPPSKIPVVTNKDGNLMLNLPIADKLGIVFSLSMIRNATIIDKDE